MNECLLALCLALGVPDGRLSAPVAEGFASPRLASSASTAAIPAAFAESGDTVPRPRAAPERPAGPPDHIFGEDKWKHFFSSFIITSLGASGARAAGLERDLSLGVGAALSLGSGAAKELFDYRNPSRGTPSALDLAWDALGTGAGVLVAAQAYDR